MKYKKHIATGVLVFSLISSSGFVIGVTNMKTKTISSVEIATSANTTYSKNGINTIESALNVGQKVIIAGNLDKTTNILTAKTVKIVTNKKNL